MTALTFAVLGRPRPAGSKRAIPIRRGGVLTGGSVVVDSSGEKGERWRGDVREAARRAGADPSSLTPGPVMLTVTFYLTRPKGHYGTGRNSSVLKPGAPAYPLGKPDATKLIRAVEDALTGLVWRDDAQIVMQTVRKRYGTPEGCEIIIAPVLAAPGRETWLAAEPVEQGVMVA